MIRHYLATTLLAPLVGFSTLIAATASRPNVVLILTDNHSYFELGCHGHPILKTPHIDRLASQSVDFQNFHAPPFCSPSRAALLTGRYALRSGVHNTVGGRSLLHPSEATLADYLGGAGYRTAIFGKWHLGASYPYHPSERGFQESFIHGGGGIGQLEDFYGNDHIDAQWERNGSIVPSQGYSTDVLFNEAKAFIRSSKDKSFFCFISTPATHTPYQAEPVATRRLKERGVEASDADMKLFSMIENIDDNIGSLMQMLKEAELEENTIVIFASDQGVNDRGALSPRPHDTRPPRSVAYDEKHAVFCMLRYPALSKAYVNTALTGMIDLAPTLLDLCGLPKIGSMDGRSLKPLLSDHSSWDDDRLLIVQCPRNRYREKWRNASVKTQDWRLVGGDRLYHARNDPFQTRNVADANPQIVEKLSLAYDAFWNSLPSQDQLLSRHLIGAPSAPEVRLVAMDWYLGGSPWHQLHLDRGKSNGVWPIQVERSGRYRFELRWFPREKPTPINAQAASLRIGSEFRHATLSPQDDHAVFTLPLQKGRFELETSLQENQASSQKDWGAYFVYVSYLGK